jgi:HAD superfamily hydrolase (TIGR01509 family)
VTAPAPGPAAGGALQAVLFDMDGLLIDSEPLWFEAERAVMARLGGHWEPADQRQLLGGSLPHTVSYLLAKAEATPGQAGRPAHPLPPPPQVARWLLAEMTGLMAGQGLPIRDGGAELVAEVARAGIPAALVTSSHRHIMQAALRATGLRFAVTVCAQDVRRTKPHPEPYLRAAALVGARPGGCAVLEDSPNGVAAAQSAGCAVVAVPSLPVPVPPNVVTAASLRDVSVAMLRAVVAEHQRGGQPAAR